MCKEKVKLTVKSEDANKGKVIVIDSSSNTVLIPSKSGGCSCDVEKDQEIRLIALGLEGYIFLEWREIQNGKSSLVTKEQDYSTKISEDKSYEAVFVPKKCKINVNVNDTSYGYIKGAGEYEYGQTATIEAVAKGGYHFVHWEDKELDNVRSFTVTKDETFTAIFKENQKVNVAIGPDDTDKGSTNPQTGDFPEGLEISVKAIAKPGYIFSHWDDGTTCNPKTVKVTEGLSIKAIFEKATPRAMFDSLLSHERKDAKRHVNCPDYEKFEETYTTANSSNAHKVVEDQNKLLSCKIVQFFKKNCGVISMVLLLLIVASLFLSINCHQEIDNLKNYCKCDKTEIPVKISTDDTCCGFIYVHHIIVDTISTCHTCTAENVDNPSQPSSQNRTSFHGDVTYRNTNWYILLCYVIIGVLVLTAIVLAIKFLMPYYIKRADFEHKMLERRYNDYIRLSDEDREYERLHYKTSISLLEKREKAIIEEWQRDNELDRKLDIMEQERIAELNNVLLELAKVKNTVTLNEPKDGGKTTTVEKSVLSGDCCNE